MNGRFVRGTAPWLAVALLVLILVGLFLRSTGADGLADRLAGGLPDLLDVLLDSAAMGVNVVEREGISFSHPARFILVGTMNPEEGELRPQLLDRFALSVDIVGIREARERVMIMERNLAFESDQEAFRTEWLPREKEVSKQIERARVLLDQVTYTSRDLLSIAALTASLNVDGHRADLVILKAARAQAASEGFHATVLRTEVQGEASTVGQRLGERLQAATHLEARPFCLIVGGETTVTLHGDGKGGRNQELALAAVDSLAGLQDVMLVSLATDGDDGPTDAAGAVVTGDTQARALALGMNAANYLVRNHSYVYFEALGDLLKRMDELDPSREIIIHCKMGGRSAQAIMALERAGFTGSPCACAHGAFHRRGEGKRGA